MLISQGIFLPYLISLFFAGKNGPTCVKLRAFFIDFGLEKRHSAVLVNMAKPKKRVNIWRENSNVFMTEQKRFCIPIGKIQLCILTTLVAL